MEDRVMTDNFGKLVLITFMTFATLIQACTAIKEITASLKAEPTVAEAQKEEVRLIRDTIKDAGRAEQFLALVAERDRLVEHFSAEVEAHRNRMFALNSDYQAERKDFEALLANYRHKRVDSQKELVELIYAMKKLTTAAEWKNISQFQIKHLNLRHLTYDAAGTEG